MAKSAERGAAVSMLFGSSVDEPVELLREVVERAFRPPLTAAYQSAFIGGNPLVVRHLCERYGVAADQVVCTTGATGALSLIYRTFLNPGDRVLVERPGFDLFADIAVAAGAVVDHFERRGPSFDVDLAEVERALTPRTRLVVLSNLHNPSGALLDEARLAALAALAEARGVLLVVDEVYGDYADAATRPGSAQRHGRNVLAVNSLTKIYGLSSLRCGWIVGDAEVVAPVREVSDHFEFGVSKLAHAAAALVFAEKQAFDRFSREIVDGARPIVEQAFADLGREGLISGDAPRFGCIAFPALTGVADTRAFSDWLADRHGVVIAPGEFFGLAGHVRVGFALPPAELETALGRFAAGLREWREQRGGRDRDGQP
jgi:aspartate/methionine/tyrosine aminotransferase